MDFSIYNWGRGVDRKSGRVFETEQVDDEDKAGDLLSYGGFSSLFIKPSSGGPGCFMS